MTANQSFDPYFLTAFHCVDSNDDDTLSVGEISNAENWLFKFQYKMTSCDGNTPTVGITYVGSYLLSAWHETDFALMEMEESPLGDYRFSWLGWDRTSSTPSSGKSIHHPSGDAMKISFENNQFQTSSWDGNNNHWLVYFNDGVVEHASSGSPILDQNDRVVGQLHGNQYYNLYLKYCVQPRAEYGRFNLSWDGGDTDDTRLSNWLNPFNSNVTTTNTARSPYISGSTLVCASGSAFTVNNLPSGSTIEWNSGYFLSRVSSQGSNPCTFSSSGIRSTWISATINLAGGGTITLPHFNVWTGVPALTSVSGPSPSYIDYGCTGQSYSFWTDPSRDALSQSSYEWAVEPSYFSWYFQSQYNDWATVVFNDPNEYYQVRVRASNTCGTSSWVSKMVSITDCYRFLLYPNPASGEVTISLTVAESVKKEEVPSNVLVRITDNSGITYYSGTKGGDSFTIPVSNLKDGNYIVSIIYDGKIENLPLIIKN